MKITCLTVVALFLILIGIQGCISIDAQASSEGNFQVYENSVAGIRISYPADWEANQNVGFGLVVGFYSPPENITDAFLENFNVGVEGLPEGTTLSEYTEASLQFLESSEGVDVVESHSTTLSGFPGHAVAYTLTSFQDSAKIMQIWTVTNDGAYVITFVALAETYSTYLPTVENAVNSFEIFEPTSSSPPIDPSTMKFLVFENATLGISIDYPDSWQKLEFGSAGEMALFVEFVSLGQPFDLVPITLDIIGVNTYEKITTEEQLNQYAISQLQTIVNDFDIVSSDEQFSLAGIPGHKVEFTGGIGGVGSNVDIKGAAHWAFKDGKLYFVIFSSEPKKYDEYLPVAERMVDSLQIIRPSPSLDDSLRFVNYENSNLGIKLEYPDNWRVIDSNNTISFHSPIEDDSDIISDFVAVGILNLPAHTTLKDYTAAQLTDLGVFISEPAVAASKSTTLSGYPAYQVELNGNLDIDSFIQGKVARKTLIDFVLSGFTVRNFEVKWMQVYMLSGTTVYQVVYVADKEKYDEYLPAVQTMITSLKIDQSKITDVSGRYTNLQAGVQIDLPPVWDYLELNDENKTTILASPRFLTPEGKSDKFMMILIQNISALANEQVNEELLGAKCEVSSVDYPKLNQTGTALEMVMECQTETKELKMKIYGIATDDKMILTAYAASTQKYDSEIAEFETSMKTLKVRGAIDILQSELPFFGWGKSQNFTAMVDGKAHTVELASSSNITNFEFSVQEKQISFIVEGTDGSRGSTVVSVGEVLAPPYSVFIDGKASQDIVIIDDKTSGDDALLISYTHSTHTITIKGAEVVPEFANVSLAAVAAGLIVFVIIFQRQSKVSRRVL